MQRLWRANDLSAYGNQSIVLVASMVVAVAKMGSLGSLRDVFFIDSSGLRSLLGASRRAQARNTVVVLRSVGAQVERLLQITGTTDQFVIESGRD